MKFTDSGGKLTIEFEIADSVAEKALVSEGIYFLLALLRQISEVKRGQRSED